MDHYSKIDALKKNAVFQGLADDQLDTLAPLLHEVPLSRGEYLFKEGDLGESFYLIADGEIDILKIDPETEIEVHLATLRAGEIFGEMASLGDHHRTTSAQAIGPVRLLEVSLDKLSHIPHASEIDCHIRSKLPNLLTLRVKGDNLAVIDAMKKKLEHEKARSTLGNFLVQMIVLIFIYFYAMRTLSILDVQVISSTIISVPILILFAAVMLRLIQKTDFPWSAYGFTWTNWKKSLVESLLFTIPILFLTGLFKWAVIHLDPASSHLTLFNLSAALNPGAAGPPNYPLFVLLIGAYFIFVPVQEIIYRGAMQSTLEQFLLGKNRTLRAILISNLPFSMIHLHLSFSLTIATYFFGAFWGWLYARHKTLLGCTISHLIIGLWGFFIIGVQDILRA